MWREKTLKSTMSDNTATITVFDDNTVGLTPDNNSSVVVNTQELLDFIQQSQAELGVTSPRATKKGNRC